MKDEWQSLPPKIRQAAEQTIQEAAPPRSIEEVKAMLESTEKGSVRNSIRNCLTVFQNDPLLSGAIAKNLLTERVDIVKPIGYHRIGTAITDTDMNYLLLYLEETYGLPVRKRLPPPSGLLPMKTATTRPGLPERPFMGWAGAYPLLPAPLSGSRHRPVHL